MTSGADKKEFKRAVGWKTNAGAVGLIVVGIVLVRSQFLNAIACILIGFIFIGLRDAVGKLIKEVCANQKALADVRAAVEVVLDRKDGR